MSAARPTLLPPSSTVAAGAEAAAACRGLSRRRLAAGLTGSPARASALEIRPMVHHGRRAGIAIGTAPGNDWIRFEQRKGSPVPTPSAGSPGSGGMSLFGATL